ncbi:MAG: hypothetical protein ACJ74U_18025 [Jatrophihabitantaceae bacterium]
MSRPLLPPTSLCIVRVEFEPTHSLITITTVRNINRRFQTESSSKLVDYREAAEQVAQFLREVAGP